MEKAFVYNSDSTVVQTTAGKIQGYLFNDVYIFKGIPYAHAKRWQAPHAVEPWEGILDCTSFGTVCPLMKLPKPRGELRVPHRYWVMDEDCQNLNLWTPACDDAKRPVLVWLHGGGYSDGSAIEHIAYDGDNAAKMGDMVYISINHRLNILGYFDVSAYGEEYANSGNAGGDDIIAALKWIHENIAAFGGDPENVTVMGQSGGGGKVTTLLQSPAADGLFHKGINMSGVVSSLIQEGDSDPKPLIDAMMKECGFTKFEEMVKAPYQVLADAYMKVRPELARAGKYVGLRPQKNAYYLGDPLKHGFRKETQDIPLMVGSVFGEFLSFGKSMVDTELSVEEQKAEVTRLIGEEAAQALLPEFEKAYPNHLPADLLMIDTAFRPGILEYVRLRAKTSDHCYSYLFDLNFDVEGRSTPWHCSDIPFFLHNTAMTPYCQIPGVTEMLEHRMFASMVNFMKNGDPNCVDLPAWPANTPDTESVMFYDKECHLETNHDEVLMPQLVGTLAPIVRQIMAKVQIQH